MSVSCGLECVVCVGCSRWAWKRLTYIGSYDSDSWPPATADDFEPIPRICRAILAVYEHDLSRPCFAPPTGYLMNPNCLIKRVPYDQTHGRCPPYIIYIDRDHREIILAVRGLNLVHENDYKVLLDNRLGMQMFDGGFVHHGLLKAALFLLKRELETIRRLLLELGPEYKLVFAGHSLGSGVAALMTVIVVNRRHQFGGIARNQIRCYAVAPARCMSLNLAVKYADVINSIVLQDDFLPRTPTPLEHIFGFIFCLPCLLFFVCMKDTFIPESRKLKDPRRLYAPGRIYHIVERKFCRCGRYPPEVKTAIPVDGRFDHVVLSCNTTSDHELLWIEREAQKALDLMKEHTKALTPPAQPRMERNQTLQKEHRDALERAVSLNVPHAIPPAEESTALAVSCVHAENVVEAANSTSGSSPAGKPTWDDLGERLVGSFPSNKDICKADAEE
ncbi:hypothetical protein KSP40_PGU019840 [Platanthera guangdongensis]|uniref:Uncharacterized protein n=1 Tax=Platanthera guangdongensis TaxID=2320717 RepID=A0ABR2MGL2_9ASPA